MSLYIAKGLTALDAWCVEEAKMRAASQPRCSDPIGTRVFNVQVDYSAVGDGSANDTGHVAAAIFAATTALGASPTLPVEIVFPPGRYNLPNATSAMFTITKSHFFVRGEQGLAAVLLLPSGIDGFDFDGGSGGITDCGIRDIEISLGVGQTGVTLSNVTDSELRDVQITHTGTPAGGQSVLISNACVNIRLVDVVTTDSWNGFVLDDALTVKMTRCSANLGTTTSTTPHAALSLTGLFATTPTQDVVATDCAFGGLRSSTGGTGVQANNCGGLTLKGCSMIDLQYGIVLDPVGFVVTNIIADSCNIDGIYDNPISITPGAGGSVIAVHLLETFGNSTGNHGVYIHTNDSTAVVRLLSFTRMYLNNEGGCGLYAYAQSGTISSIRIVGGEFMSNNGDAGQWAGIWIEGSIEDVLIEAADCDGTGTGSSNNQYTGIDVRGTASDVQVIGCNVINNTIGIKLNELPTNLIVSACNATHCTTPIYTGSSGFNGLGSNCRITGNLGYNPFGYLTAPSITTSQTNGFPFPVDVLIGSGSLTKVQITDAHGVQKTAGAFLGQYTLQPGESIVVTYGGAAPLWSWKGQ